MFKLVHSGSGQLFYATRDSAGFDICASESLEIAPGTWAMVPTGLRITEVAGESTVTVGGVESRVIPEIQIRPRSGLAAKHGVTVLNAPSTIDADYRGEIKIILINHSSRPFPVAAGDRIAQGVCALVVQLPGIAVQDTARGEGGFGSTGRKS